MDNKIDPMKPERTKEEILKDALNNWVEEYAFQVPYHNKGPIANDDYYDQLKLKYGSDGFKAGAKWMEEYRQSSPVESKREEELERVIRKAYKWLKEPHVPIGSVITLLRKAIERSELPIEETKEK